VAKRKARTSRPNPSSINVISYPFLLNQVFWSLLADQFHLICFNFDFRIFWFQTCGYRFLISRLF
jgi:hypothetical protein